MAATQRVCPAVGDFIKQARQQQGLSQRTLSGMIGRSPAYLSKLEAGSIEPSFVGLAQIAFALQFSALEVWTLCRIALTSGSECHTPLGSSEPTDEVRDGMD